MSNDQGSSGFVAVRFALAALLAIGALAFAATGTTAAEGSFLASVRAFFGIASKTPPASAPKVTNRFGGSIFEGDAEPFTFFGPFAARTWANAGTDFNTVANWLVALPGSGDIATFTGAASVQPNVSSNITVSGVNFSDFASSGYNLSSSSSSISLLLNSTTTGSTGAINSAITSGTNTINAPLVLNAASGTQTFTQASGGTLVLNGEISSTNSPLLSFAGSGTTQINGSNLHSGGTTVNTGTFQIGNNSAFGSGTFSLGNSTATIIQATGGSRTVSNNTVWGGSATISGGNAFTFNGSFTSSGSNTRTMTVNNTGGVILGGNVFLSETDSSSRTLTILGSSPVTINGVVTNNNVANTLGSSLLYTGSSTLTLSNTNTYGGNTSISGGGTISVSTIGNSGSNGGVGAGATINLGSTTTSGTLLYTGSGEDTSKVINLLGQTGGGTIDQSGTGLLKFTATNLTATGAGIKTLTLQGSTAGTGEIGSNIKDNSGANKTSLIKTGTSSWTLSVANDYMGTTTINGGTLFVTGSTSPESAVTVNNTGTLGGTGTVLGATVSVASGGTVAPGLSPGILNIGNSGNSSALSFASGSTFAVEVGGTTAGNASNNHDQLNVYGTVALGDATLSISSFNGFTPSAGQTFTIINKNTAGAISGTFNGLVQGATVSANFLGSGLSATISYTGGDGNDVVITVSAPPSHTVTFNGNGNTGGSMSNQVANTATNLTANAFTRTGYIFSGWNTLANGTGTAYGDQASYPFTADVTLYAQWTIDPSLPETTIDTGPAEGSTVSSTSATFTFSSSTIGATFQCKLDSGGFVGCTSPRAYSGLSDGTHTFMVRAVDAGSNVDPSPASRTWTVDTTPPPPTVASVNPTSGSTLGGNSVTITGTNLTGVTGVTFGDTNCPSVNFVSDTEINCTAPAHAAGTVSVEVTTPGGTSASNSLFTYIAPTFTVTFDGNGNTGGSMSSQAANTATNLTANAFTRTGYTFASWNTVAVGGGTTYADQASYPFTADVTLYAQWTINQYTLTYNGNGNTGGTAPSPVMQNYNTTVAVAGKGDLVKSLDHFLGWNTAANGGGTNYAVGSTFTFAADTTLYARWLTACPAGKYFNGSACVPADPGNFVSGPGQTAQTPCAEGSYQPNSGSVACNPADAGSYVSGVGQIAQTLCDLGKYQPNPGQSSCLKADAGFYVPTEGAQAQTPTPAGTFIAILGSATQGQPCSAGYYQPNAGQTSCLPADPGFYVPSTGATSQTPCATGYGSAGAATQCTINTYILTYNGNGNSGGTAPTGATQNYNTTIAVAAAGSLVKTNSIFTGWNTVADGSGTAYAPAATFTFTADTTLFAQWASGTAAGDFFRSRTTGDWGTPATWESSSNNSTWITATLSPASAASTITVQSPHVVTVTAGVTADEVTVDPGGTLALGAALANGGAMAMNGTLQINTGGSLTGTAPNYGGSSTLVYNNVSSNVGTEWTGNSTTAGLGVPQDVTVTGAAANMQLPAGVRGLAGNMTLTGSAILKLDTTPGSNLNVGGNWTSGGFLQGAGLVTFNGAGDQTISRPGGERFTNLTINKPSGTVILGSGVAVDGVLTLTSGNINTTSGFLSVENTAAAAISGGSASSYIEGGLVRFLPANPASGSTYVFPVGTVADGSRPATIGSTNSDNSPLAAAEYSPLTATINSGTLASILTVSVTDSVLTGLNANISVTRYWTVTQTGGAIDANLAFTYLDQDVNGDETAYKVYKNESNATTEVTPSAINAPANSATVNGVTSFSLWGVGIAYPTAAGVSITGRVMTADGRGIPRAMVSVSGRGFARPIAAMTGPSGYYRLNDLEAGQTYVVTVNSKRYRFTVPSRIVTLDDNVTGLDFVASP